MARALARDPDRVAEWERAVRVQASLATKLRLSPQSPLDPKTVARRMSGVQFSGRAPWEDPD
jgi:hypothetical protein